MTKPDDAAYPFVFVNHGLIDAESVEKCEEVFLWFRGAVDPALREEIFRDCPAPLREPYCWDREFCYFGSQGDSYDYSVTMTYAPPAVVAALESNVGKDPKAWGRAYAEAQRHQGRSIAAFCADLDRWVRRVHTIAPIAAFWGPHGADSRDPWNAWSLARFADVMNARLRDYKPERTGRKHLGWIKNMCGDLLVAPTPRAEGARKTRAAADDARSIEVLDDAARRNRPRRYVSRLSPGEQEVLLLGEQVAGFIGAGPGAPARLARLAPLTQLMFLAGYDADDRVLARAGLDVAAAAVGLVARLEGKERRSAVALLTMLAQTLVRDTPAFERPRRREGSRAAEVLRAGFDQPGARAATYARASRYLRWAGRAGDARALAEDGLSRFGERKVLLRAAMKAAAKGGDEAAQRAYEARMASVASAG